MNSQNRAGLASPRRFRRTRIVATIGPASASERMVRRLLDAGVDVFRMNFSHGDYDMHRVNFAMIRRCAAELDRPVGILQDLQGPKIRVRTFVDGSVDLKVGRRFDLTCEDESPGDDKRVGVSYRGLWKDVVVGDKLLLDDGRLRLLITDIVDQTICTDVEIGGELSNRKGINIPGSDLSLPALTEKDVADLKLGAELNVDWVAMSFVRSLQDVLMTRKQMEWANSTAKLMAKIEKPAAVENFDAILNNVDGIMVARGDLGVEISPERVPAIQKRLIRRCREAGKPVVTATQMLESMITSPAPTRAEASDVANAIYDGTDAVMLSAETAVGNFPVEAVQMMNAIALSVESDRGYWKALRRQRPSPGMTVADSVSLSACDMARRLDAAVIACFSASGATASRVSRFRNQAPILVITTSRASYQQMAVTWGLHPVLKREVANTDEMVIMARQSISQMKAARDGDRYVITAGVPFGIMGTTNLIRVEKYYEI